MTRKDDNGVIRNVRIISWLCAASPAVALALFMTLALHLRVALGYWATPRYEETSPVFWVHTFVFFGWLIFTFFAAGPVWIACAIVGWSQPRQRRIFGLQAVVFLAACGLVYAAIGLDPAWFAEFVLD